MMKGRIQTGRGTVCRLFCALTASLLLVGMRPAPEARAEGIPVGGFDREICGDVNRDGALDASDYMMLKRCVLGTYQLEEVARRVADVNRDGVVDAVDYMAVKRAVLGTFTLDAGSSSGGTPSEGTPSPGTSPGTEGTQTRPAAEQLLQLVNEARAREGLKPLTLAENLCVVANAKAQDMVDNRYFSHESPTYGTPFEMLRKYGISYRTAGENIAAGQQSAQAVFDAWMGSEGHRANILGAGYTQLGIGIAYGGQYGIYWVQLFTS